MANPCKVMLPVSLLILAATQGHCSQLDQEQSAFVDSMRGISQALQCISDSTQDGMRLQRESTDSLRDVVLQQKEDIILMKKDVAAFLKVDKLTQEITNMKTQLEDRDKKVITLSEENQDLQKKIESIIEMIQEMNKRFMESQELLEETVRLRNNTIQELNKRFMETQQHVELLEETVRQLNGTMKNPLEEGCEIALYRQHKQEIDQLVGEFSRTSSWISLIDGLRTVIDHNDDVYRMVQNIRRVYYPMWHIGTEGYTQLALLLLCAGFPVNFPDSDGDSMLHGAASGGQLELVKLLVQHGADVNMTGKGLTPLERARNNHRFTVVAYLEQTSH